MIDVESAYRRWSESYDLVENRTRDLDAAVLRASGLERADRDVVEIGCGTGKNTSWLADGARSLVALDLSEEMLARARARISDARVRFVRHDVRTPWPLDTASADLVAVNLVLEHILEVAPVFAEAARVLRAGGRLYVSEFHPYRQLLGRGAKLSDAPEDRVEAYVHSVAEYVNAALGAGLALERIDEWCDDDASSEAPGVPRLLTLHLRL
jgi:ubiquinone/menaquinone biosynthesis C-methylase UbiE